MSAELEAEPLSTQNSALSTSFLGGLLLSRAEDLLERRDEFDECLLRGHVRRQQADHGVARGADDEAFLEQLARDRRRRAIELDAPHEARSPHVDDRRAAARLQGRELAAEPIAVGLDARQQRRIFDFFEYRQAEAARDRA